MTIRSERHYDQDLLGTTLYYMARSLVPLKVDLTSNANTADTNEDTLTTYSIAANTMGPNACFGFEIEAWGVTGANGDNKVIKLYFGSIVLSSGTVTANNKSWHMRLRVYRSGTNTQVAVGDGCVDATPISVSVTTGAETETAAITTKITGQNSSNPTASSVVAKAFSVAIIEQLKVT